MSYRVRYSVKVPKLVKVGPLFCAPEIFTDWVWEPRDEVMTADELVKLAQTPGVLVGAWEPV